ncbi:MAG TPA: VWA domain-containing protein [Dissulfurispiraceae bacterium]|nr:VWA domain-containing protein [Dissulfurispiraceae bacterium]
MIPPDRHDACRQTCSTGEETGLCTTWSAAAVLFLLPLFLCLLFPHGIHAAVKQKSTKAQETRSSKHGEEGIDVILLMDSSGSMKKTDPKSYRKPAARLFISLLGEQDRVGIVSFGDRAKVLIGLTDNRPAHRGKLLNSVQSIGSQDLSTNIPDGIRAAAGELGSSGRKDKIIVMMSDGKLALGSEEKDKAASEELSKLLRELAGKGIKLYTIAFTEASDQKLLEEIARVTSGSFHFAKTDQDIHVVFSSLYEKMKSPDAVPLEGESFSIDGDIKEATIVITKKPGTATVLVDPGQKRYTAGAPGKNLQWFEGDVFDMITIRQPLAGTWKAGPGSPQGGRIFVITDLHLRTSFQRNFLSRGDVVTLDAWLEKNGARITDRGMLDAVSLIATLVGPDGRETKIPLADQGVDGDAQAGDGVFTSTATIAETGEYKVVIAAQAGAFKREKVVSFRSVESAFRVIDGPVVGEKVPGKDGAVTAARKQTDEVQWDDVLFRFGIINVVVLSVCLAVFGIVKLIRMRR